MIQECNIATYNLCIHLQNPELRREPALGIRRAPPQGGGAFGTVPRSTPTPGGDDKELPGGTP